MNTMCDCCGKYINKIEPRYIIEIRKAIGFEVSSTSIEFDFCNSCFDEFKDFIKKLTEAADAAQTISE